MAESGAGDADYGRSAAAQARPASPMEELALEGDPPFEMGFVPPTESRLREMGPPLGRKVPPVVSTVIRPSATERDEAHMDDELKALGLWEEDMTEEQKKQLLRVVADSKETAQREEAVRKSHFPPRPAASSEAATRDAWEKKEPPVGLVKPCMATPEPPLCSDRLDHMSRKFIAKVGEDNDWPPPGPCVNPSRRNMSIFKPSKRIPATQRMCSMDQPVQLQWDYEDSSEDLYDARLHREPTGARAKEEPAGLWGPSALLSSWEALHAALRSGQSAPGLPVRPWGHVRDAASPMGPQDGGNRQELPSKGSPDEAGDARPISAMEDGEAQGGGQA